MDKKIIVLVIIIASLLSCIRSTKMLAQLQYWTALNYDIYIREDGTALVTAKFHPFSVYGKSLYRNSTIEKELMEGEKTMITEILLMFSRYPQNLKYQVLSHLHPDDSYSVLCDVRNIGRMEKMDGAYILQILVFLNSSEFVRVLKDDIFEVKIRDSYTSQNPNSWIDILNVTFSPSIGIEKISWEPSFAHGPANKTKNSFLWINLNQLEAPDFYVFHLRIPEFKIVATTKISGRIIDAYLSKSYVYVKVENNSSNNGYILVRLLTDYLNQTRKVYVASRKSKNVVFPLPVNSSKIIVEIWGDHKKLDTKIVKLEEKKVPRPIYIPYRKIALILAIIGAVITIVSLFLHEKTKESQQPHHGNYYH